jgi:tetratricopeptide (TPR) repeat protein
VLAALDCDSTGVRRFFFRSGEKSITSQRARRSGYLNVYGDSAYTFAPDPSDDGVEYGQSLSSIGAIAVRDSLVVITDPDRDRFAVLRNGTGTVLETLGDEYKDERRLKSPEGIALTPQGRVVLADMGKDCLHTFSADRASVSSIPFIKAFGVAVDPDENIYAWARDGGSLCRIRRESQKAVSLEPPTYPARVSGLAFDPAGNSFALDFDSQQILIVPRKGKQLLFAFGPEGAYEDPAGIMVDPTGNIYIPDRKLQRTVVYRWSISLPPPSPCIATYDSSGVTLSWGDVPGNVWGYEVSVVDGSGLRTRLARTRDRSCSIRAAAGGAGVPGVVDVATVSLSGTTGSPGPRLSLPGLSALASLIGGNEVAAAPKAAAAAEQIQEGGSYAADSSAIASFRLILLMDALRRGDHAGAISLGSGLEPVIPVASKATYHRKMGEAYLASGGLSGARTELLALAGCAHAPGVLADSDLVRLTFRVFDQTLAASDTTGAIAFLRAYAERIPESEPELRAVYEQRLRVANTRIRLGRGLDLWRALEYEAAIDFFDRLLTTSGSELDPEERILSYEILAAAYFAFGRKAEARTEYMNLFVLDPAFNLAVRAERAERLYNVVIFNRKMMDFFEELRPKETGGK